MQLLTLACVLTVLGACASEAGSLDERTIATSATSSDERSSPAARDVAGEQMGGAGFGSDSPPALAPVTSPPAGPDPSVPSTDPNAPSAAPDACPPGMFCGPTGPDSDNCGSLRLEQDVEIVRNPGNVLIVFDQSASMQEPWGAAGGSKLQAAQAAVTTAISSLSDLLTVGAIFFPTAACAGGGPGQRPGGQLPGGQRPGGQLPGGLGGPVVQPITGPGQIPFQPAAQFLTAWNAHWAQLGAGANIGTPMQEAFDRADEAIQSSTLPGQLVVVAFTDGQPNCFPAPGTITATEPERATNWLASKNIKTYVVGLPGAQGVEILNNVAVSGGTMQYILPDDPAALETKLKELVGETIKMGFDSCSINLTPAADPADKLQMVVEENGVRQRVERMLSANAGWSITPDGTRVEITGQLCEDAKAGRFESITFEYGCKELPPLPPPMGPI
jgi:hypothetical protein